jgi:lysylphosphatidylglycerol synthetase-like protein (DUF2156 family)
MGEREMLSASLLIVLLVGLVVGALTGLALGGIVAAFISRFWLASSPRLSARSLATQFWSTDQVPERRCPLVVIVFAAVASLGGSSAALELATHSHDLMSTSVWIGALAGLFSSMLMAMLMITYQMNPVKKERSSKRR